jgi:regulatory protein
MDISFNDISLLTTRSTTYTLNEATKKLEHFCAYQERCHKEVMAKLRSMGMIPMAIDQIMAHLIQENFLNEERFARSYARGKFTIKKWGRQRIVRELKQREVSTFNIKAALSEISQSDYLETFEVLANKRWEQLRDSHLETKKRKLSQYLLYRGWESHLVYDFTNSLGVTD